jgi:hypothetical protein
MANKNTRAKQRALAKAFTVEHRAGRKITSPPSKRRRQWRGSPAVKRTAAIQSPTAATSDGKFR